MKSWEIMRKFLNLDKEQLCSCCVDLRLGLICGIGDRFCNILLFLPYLPIIKESLIIFCVHVKHEFKVKEPLNPYPDESLDVSGEFLGPIMFWLSFTRICGPKSTFLS